MEPRTKRGRQDLILIGRDAILNRKDSILIEKDAILTEPRTKRGRQDAILTDWVMEMMKLTAFKP